MDWSYIWAVIPILWEELLLFLYHCTLLFGVNFVELGHSSISNKVKRPYWKIMYSFMSPMKMIRCWTQQILFCCAIMALQFFLFLTHVFFFFFFGPTKGTIVHYTRPSSCVSICLLYNFILFSPWHLDLLSSLAIFVVWMVA